LTEYQPLNNLGVTGNGLQSLDFNEDEQMLERDRRVKENVRKKIERARQFGGAGAMTRVNPTQQQTGVGGVGGQMEVSSLRIGANLVMNQQ